MPKRTHGAFDNKHRYKHYGYLKHGLFFMCTTGHAPLCSNRRVIGIIVMVNQHWMQIMNGPWRGRGIRKDRHISILNTIAGKHEEHRAKLVRQRSQERIIK